MGFVRFQPTVAVVKPAKTAKPAKPAKVKEKAPRKPFLKIERNGETAYILHFNTEAVRRFGLKEKDRVILAMDAKTNRVGIKKDADGDFVLTAHGGNPARLKVSITHFFRTHLAENNLPLPFKGEVSVSRNGYMTVNAR